MDEAQVIDDAIGVLNEVQKAYRSDPIAHIAALLSHEISPRMAFDAKPDFETKDEHSDTPKKFAREAGKVLASRNLGYKTSVFKCLDDFENCKHKSSHPICRALFAICVGKQLIPFTK